MHQKFSGTCHGSKVYPGGDPLYALGLCDCTASKCIVICSVFCNCRNMNSVTSQEVHSNRPQVLGTW